MRSQSDVLRVLAELGTQLAQFPSGSHLVSRTGLCPAAKVSAGKRLGSKKAIVALAHRILITIYHLLKDQQSYRELGPGHAQEEQVLASSKRWAIRRLEHMGSTVTLTPTDREAA